MTSQQPNRYSRDMTLWRVEREFQAAPQTQVAVARAVEALLTGQEQDPPPGSARAGLRDIDKERLP